MRHLTGAASVVVLTLAGLHGALSADATWTGAVDGVWNTGGNWSSGAAPDGTAIFSGAGPTAITFASLNPFAFPNGTEIGTIQIDAGAPTYTFTMGISGSDSIAFMGGGIVNNSVNLPNLVNGGLIINFMNASSAGNAIVNNGGGINFNDTSTAGNATINNPMAFLAFLNFSSAGNAVINNGNILQFANDATAGSSAITSTASGSLTFSEDAKAGNASILSSGSMDFFDRSTAGNATITSSGAITFFNFTSADHATIINNSSFRFGNDSTAGSAAITNNGSLQFFSRSTGGNAAVTNTAGHAVDFSLSVGPALDHKLTVGSIAGDGDVYLGTNQLTVGNNNQSTIFNGAISDCGVGGSLCLSAGALGGSLVKTGTGTFSLTGTNIYTGATTVAGGTLTVNGSIVSSSAVSVAAGGTLGGNGIVSSTTINAGGTLSPGNSIGTINVSGNLAFLPGSVYAVEVSPSSADKTIVSGAAVLAGNVHSTFAPGVYIPKSYTILTAAGGLGGTKFDGVTGSAPSALQLALSYTPTDVRLDMTSAVGQLAGLNQNQQIVASAIDGAFNSGGGIGGGFSSLYNLPPGSLPGALSQLSGEAAAGATQTSLQSMSSFLGLMLNPFLDTRSVTTGPALGFAPERTLSPEAAAAYAAVNPVKSASGAAAGMQRFGLWGSGYGGQGRVDGNVTTGSQSISARTYGFATGLDYRVNSDTILGFALSGGGTSWSLAGGLGGGHSDLFQGGVYGTTHFGAAYLGAALGYAWHDVTVTRTVAIAGVDRLESDFDANVFGGRVESGYRVATPWLAFTPYAAIQAQTVHTPSYRERALLGSAQFALDYAAQTTTTTRTELGAWFDKAFALDAGSVLTLRGRVAWAHDSDNDRRVTALFQSLPNASFTVDGAVPAPDGALVSAGAEIRLAHGFSIGAKFDGEFSSTTDIYAETGVLRYVW